MIKAFVDVRDHELAALTHALERLLPDEAFPIADAIALRELRDRAEGTVEAIRSIQWSEE